MFDIGSESCRFFSGVSFVLLKITCIIFAAFTAFLHFISFFVSSMLPKYLHILHSWVVLFIKSCSVFSWLIIRPLDTNTSVI